MSNFIEISLKELKNQNENDYYKKIYSIDTNSINKSRSELKKNTFRSISRIAEASSIHGVPQVVRTERLSFKLFWIFFIIGSSVVCAYFTIKTVVEYFNYEKNTKITSLNEFRAEFPIVSICNYNNYSFELKPLSCYFNFENLSSNWKKHFEVYNDSRYGRCYRFNSGKNFYGENIPIKYATSPGYYYGLELNLYVETTLDFGQLKIYIHNKSMIPTSLSNKGFFITSGSYNHFEINRIFNELLEEPYNNCLKDLRLFQYNDTLIKYIWSRKRTYSQQECIGLCQNLHFLETAGCNCSISSLEVNLYSTCIRKQTDTGIKNCTSNFIEEFQRKNVYEVCSNFCPLECDSDRLVISHFSEVIQARGLINNSFNFLEFKTYENVSRSFFLIYVYYENLGITLISQQPRMELFDLFSNIGGLFGLFLGMGVLSFIEICEFLIEILNFIVKFNMFNKT